MIITCLVTLVLAAVITASILKLGRAIEKHRQRSNGLTPVRRLALRVLQFGEWLYGNDGDGLGPDLIVMTDASPLGN